MLSLKTKEVRVEESQYKLKEGVGEMFENNKLFTLFTHLVNYESSYYTYLLAKPIAYRLFHQEKHNPVFSREVQELFRRGGAYGGDMGFRSLL